MINWLKVAAIRAADAVNRAHDPFQDFDRPAMPKYAEPLSAKAAKFEDDLTTVFWRPADSVFGYTLGINDWTPDPVGDESLWHGVATAMWAWKYAVTGDPVAGNWLSACVDGMAAQQSDGRLARSIRSGVYTWGTSNDQATGHLLGLCMAWRHGGDLVKAKVTNLMDAWAYRILQYGHALTNPDGSVTTYGQLVDGWRTDPLRLSLCGAIYHNAYQMTGDPIFRKACQWIVDTYGELIEYPKVKLLWYDTEYDTHRAAIHLALLPGSQASVWRMWRLARKQGNVWVSALCRLTGVGMAEDRATALKVLSEFTLEDKQFCVGHINSNDAMVEKTLWNGEWVTKQPLPKWRISAQDFFWQRDPYNLDFGVNGIRMGYRYNGLDYLAAYWLMRYHKVLTEAD